MLLTIELLTLRNKNLIKLKTITVGDSNIPLLTLGRTNRQQVKKHVGRYHINEHYQLTMT